MPKVTEEYFASKKKAIVDAAIRVCEFKPAYAVTMRDVVKECGISQGGIYYYFSSIDEILTEIIDQAFSEIRNSYKVDFILESDMPPDKIIIDSFKLIGRSMDSLFSQYRSLIQEIISIQMSEPERMAKFGIKTDIELTGFLNRVGDFIESRKADGSFKGSISRDHILFLTAAAITGIGKAITFPDDAKNTLRLIGLTGEEYTTAESMMEVLAEIIVQLVQ